MKRGGESPTVARLFLQRTGVHAEQRVGWHQPKRPVASGTTPIQPQAPHRPSPPGQRARCRHQSGQSYRNHPRLHSAIIPFRNTSVWLPQNIRAAATGIRIGFQVGLYVTWVTAGDGARRSSAAVRQIGQAIAITNRDVFAAEDKTLGEKPFEQAVDNFTHASNRPPALDGWLDPSPRVSSVEPVVDPGGERQPFLQPVALSRQSAPKTDGRQNREMAGSRSSIVRKRDRHDQQCHRSFCQHPAPNRACYPAGQLELMMQESLGATR